MSKSGAQATSQVEFVVLGLVVLAIISIGVDLSGNETQNLEVTHISGTISLSTQSSLEAFGLGGFDQYADALIELDSEGVFSEDCDNCVTPPVGIHLNGTILISNLTGGGPGLGFVEGQLDVVYLREFVSDGLIGREWLTIDWGAGDRSRHWEIFMHHSPPRWSPDNRSLAAFVPVDTGQESRTGPWVFVEVMLNHGLNVQGCLPDSSRCVGSPSSDINLQVTRDIVSPLKSVQHPPKWSQFEVNPNNSNSPTILSDIRGLMEMGDPVNSSPWCHETDQEIVAFQAWNVSGNNGLVIAPMSTWLDALTLPSTSFTPTGGTWREVDTANNLGCAGLLDNNGNLRFGISFQE